MTADKSDTPTPERWQEATEQKPRPCACLFEWRPVPDFSGVPPKLIDECGYHATRRRELEAKLAALKAKLKAEWIYVEDLRKQRVADLRKCMEIAEAYNDESSMYVAEIVRDIRDAFPEIEEKK